MDKLDKRFYKIGDVAEILHIPESTLRYWEKQFTIINPRRNAKNTRLYTPADIEVIRKIHYLVKEKGFKGLDMDHPNAQNLLNFIRKNYPDFLKDDSIKWNFTKFLIDRDGNVVARFEPTKTPEAIAPEIEKLL